MEFTLGLAEGETRGLAMTRMVSLANMIAGLGQKSFDRASRYRRCFDGALQQYSRGIHKVGATVSVGVAAHPAPTNIDALLARAARPHGNGHEAGRPWEKGRRAGEKPALQSGEEAITQRNSVLNEDCARMVNG